MANADLFSEIDNDQNASGDLLDAVPETDAEPWLPDPGDGISGIVTELSSIPDQYNPEDIVPIVVLTTADGAQRSVIGFRAGLRKEIRAKDPRVGDEYAVKYLGTRTVKKGQFAGSDYHVYRSAVRRGVGVPNTAPAPAKTAARSADPPF